MRLFIGIPVDLPVQHALQAFCEQLQKVVPARYVLPVLYHITLAYLGEREADRLPSLRSLMNGFVAGVLPFSLCVNGIGYFGKPTKAILHATLQPSESLLAVNDALRSVLRLAGERFDDQPLVPHITLARDAVLGGSTEDSQSLLSLQDAFPHPAFTAQSLTLFHSTRIEGALAYLPVHNAPFQHDGGIP